MAHAGVVLPRLLADRLGLTTGLAEALSRKGFTPGRHRGRAVVDAACALAAGASCLTDVEAWTRQQELYGPDGGASDTTLLRVLGEVADRLTAQGLPGRRLAAATAAARAAAWEAIIARHGGLPPVRAGGLALTRPVGDGQDRPVVVVRLDATLIEAASEKENAEPHRKGFGFHPLTGWCSNTGEALAVMLRPGSAGSFTASDHLVVIDAALGQVPAPWRRDVLVTIDGAGASHDVIDHLTTLNTAAAHGKRGRRVEYSIGWAVDARTKSFLAKVRDRDWTDALAADGAADTHAQVVDLTGIARTGPGGDQLAGWPKDLRLIARRTPRAAGEQLELGEDPDWRYGAFVTNTPARAGPTSRRAPPHPSPRRGPDQGNEGQRRRPAPLDRLRPQHRLATARRPRRHPRRLATADRPRG